jgi:hypothetical protein
MNFRKQLLKKYSEHVCIFYQRIEKKTESTATGRSDLCSSNRMIGDELQS